jgi:hypothetical protein
MTPKMTKNDPKETKTHQFFFINKIDDQPKWYKIIDLVIFRSHKLNFFIDFSKSLVLLKIEIIIFLTIIDQFCVIFQSKEFFLDNQPR